jgi:predicted metal-binding protein
MPDNNRRDHRKKQKYASYIKRAKELGVKEAKIIPVKSIIAAEWVRLKCQFGCDGYGRCLTCPPHSPTPDETRRMLRYYKHALLIHGDEHVDIRSIASTIEREMFLDGYFKAFGMGAGPCYLCDACAKFCRHSDKARPSLEACGIDVFTTVRSNGFFIKTLQTQNCKGNYYGIVLIE